MKRVAAWAALSLLASFVSRADTVPPPAASQGPAAPVSGGADPASLRAAFLEAANGRRAERRLPPLRVDRSLERAAQTHAEDLLGALRAGKPATSVTDLGELVEEELRIGGGASTTGGSVSYQQRESMRAQTRLRAGAVGVAVVVDALAAAQAVDAAAGAERPSDLFAAGYAAIGIGVVVDVSGPSPKAVWVAALTRR